MRRKTALIILILLVGVSSVQAGDITFSSSGTISNGDVYDNVYVENDGTVVDMSGGQIADLLLSDNSTFNLLGGQISSLGLGSAVNVEALSNFNMSNGIADLDGLYLYGAGIASINGGTLSVYQIKVYSGAKLILDNANVYLDWFDVYGGQLDIFGGNVVIDDAYFPADSTINIHGYNFNYDPTGGYGGDGILTGYLSDGGDIIIDRLDQWEYEQINFVPEPATISFFVIGTILVRRKFIS